MNTTKEYGYSPWVVKISTMGHAMMYSSLLLMKVKTLRANSRLFYLKEVETFHWITINSSILCLNHSRKCKSLSLYISLYINFMVYMTREHRWILVKQLLPISGKTTRIPNSIQYKAKDISSDEQYFKHANTDGDPWCLAEFEPTGKLLTISKNSTKQWNGTEWEFRLSNPVLF